MELRQYTAVILRWLWLVLACTLIAAVSALAVSSRMTPVYSASVTLMVQQLPTSGISDYTALITSERLARTYSEMLTARPVMERVIRDLNLKRTAESLADDVTVETVANTQLIRLRVEDKSAVRAAQIANSIADAFVAQTQELQNERYTEYLANVQAEMDTLAELIDQTETQIDALGTADTPSEKAELGRLQTILAEYRNSYATLLDSRERVRLTAAQSADTVVVVDPATVPLRPVRPRPVRNTVLAGTGGLVLAIGIAFLLEYLDDTIKTPEDVSQTMGLSTLGAIGRLAEEEDELILASNPLSPVSEAFRVLRTNIRFSSVDRPLRTILVTSPGPTEGKSLTVVNLATAMAQGGFSVAAVDADLRRPRLHHLFGLQPRGGLTGALLEESLNGRLQPVDVADGLVTLLSGDLPPNPAEMLGSERMRRLLDALAQEVDVVLIDSPPVLPVTDAAVLAPAVDGVLLVVEAGETRREMARRAVESLRQVGANLIGVVINGVGSGKRGYYYYYYRYYHRYYGDGETTQPHHRRRKKRKGPVAAVQRLFRKRHKSRPRSRRHGETGRTGANGPVSPEPWDGSQRQTLPATPTDASEAVPAEKGEREHS